MVDPNGPEPDIFLPVRRALNKLESELSVNRLSKPSGKVYTKTTGSVLGRETQPLEIIIIESYDS